MRQPVRVRLMILGGKNKSIRISPDFILVLSLGYLYVPLILFLVTWLKLWIAVIAAAVCLYGTFCVFRDFREDVTEDIRIGVLPLAMTGVILIGTGVLCGWGGWLPQADDWSKHNALLMDLMNRPWPVYYSDAVSPSMLTYYIGQYLIPAAFGKVFHSFRAAEIAMYIWGEAGLFLITTNLLRVLKADTAIKQVGTALMLVFFSGGLLLSQQLFEVISENASMDMQWMTSINGSLLQYRSNFVDLRWVMPQCLSIWLIVTLWWNHKEQIRDYIPLMIPACLNGILSFAGIIPMAILCACIEFCEHRMGIKEIIGRIFSPQNILSAVCPGGILLAYYAGNIFSDKPEGVGFSFNSITPWLYITFVIGHFGIYCLLIWKRNWKNGIFMGAFVTLLILPFFCMGYWNDLVMCCSIPGLFVMMICVTDYLFRFPNTFASGVLTAVVFVSALNPMKEAISVIRYYVPGQLNHNVSVESLADYSNLVDEEISAGWKYNYYSYNVDDNIFIEYFAQSKP